jgi:hypothetical protein
MWLQDRRRSRRQTPLPPTPELIAQYPSLAVWNWIAANPVRWNAYNSLDGGVTYNFDDFVLGTARQYAPDGGQHLMFIVGVDGGGTEITGRSNAVRPDAGIAPPVITVSGYEWDATESGWADVSLDWTFDHAGQPMASMEVWRRLYTGALVFLGAVPSNYGWFYDPVATENEATFYYQLRYRNGATLGPFGAPFRVDVNA